MVEPYACHAFGVSCQHGFISQHIEFAGVPLRHLYQELKRWCVKNFAALPACFLQPEGQVCRGLFSRECGQFKAVADTVFDLAQAR